MKTKIIAFAGRKQSGKTTCAEHLASKCTGDKVCKVYNFADPLKRTVCMDVLGLTYTQCYGDDAAKNTLTECKRHGKNMTAREVMQYVGTDIFRTIKNDVWSAATIGRIEKDSPFLALVADCRFPNEVECIKNAGGVVVKLERNVYNSNHASETALDHTYFSIDNFDLVIDNTNKTVQETLNELDNFLTLEKLL
jgi:hypothetical protein